MSEEEFPEEEDHNEEIESFGEGLKKGMEEGHPLVPQNQPPQGHFVINLAPGSQIGPQHIGEIIAQIFGVNGPFSQEPALAPSREDRLDEIVKKGMHMATVKFTEEESFVYLEGVRHDFGSYANEALESFDLGFLERARKYVGQFKFIAESLQEYGGSEPQCEVALIMLKSFEHKIAVLKEAIETPGMDPELELYRLNFHDLVEWGEKVLVKDDYNAYDAYINMVRDYSKKAMEGTDEQNAVFAEFTVRIAGIIGTIMKKDERADERRRKTYNPGVRKAYEAVLAELFDSSFKDDGAAEEKIERPEGELLKPGNALDNLVRKGYRLASVESPLAKYEEYLIFVRNFFNHVYETMGTASPEYLEKMQGYAGKFKEIVGRFLSLEVGVDEDKCEDLVELMSTTERDLDEAVTLVNNDIDYRGFVGSVEQFVIFSNAVAEPPKKGSVYYDEWAKQYDKLLDEAERKGGKYLDALREKKKDILGLMPSIAEKDTRGTIDYGMREDKLKGL